jgi:hypothetical protein
MLKIHAEYKKDISSAKFTVLSRQISSDSLLAVSDGMCQRALVVKSGIIRTERGRTIYQKMVAVHETLCTIPPRNSSQAPLITYVGLYLILTLLNLRPEDNSIHIYK